MAKPPVPVPELNAKFGPHLNFAPPGRMGRIARLGPDKLVKTHC